MLTLPQAKKIIRAKLREFGIECPITAQTKSFYSELTKRRINLIVITLHDWDGYALTDTLKREVPGCQIIFQPKSTKPNYDY